LVLVPQILVTKVLVNITDYCYFRLLKHCQNATVHNTRLTHNSKLKIHSNKGRLQSRIRIKWLESRLEWSHQSRFNNSAKVEHRRTWYQDTKVACYPDDSCPQ